MNDQSNIYKIESNIFDVIHELHKTFMFKNKERYKLYLVALDELNSDYKKLTGNYYINEFKALEYYEKLWKM